MPDEAKLTTTEHGLVPEGDGWYVINAKEAAWHRNERYGTYCSFEGDQAFPEFGINIHILEPGRANGMYHRETQQEDFLVLHGECILIVEEQERRLRAWDFVHCPAGTTHIFVGAGDGPCAILMAGSRRSDATITYPASETARTHDAGVAKATNVPSEAYAGAAPWEAVQSPWPL